jgi:hypothetical protein
MLAIALTLFSIHPLPAPLNAAFIRQASAESRDDLYKKCRQAIFRRYGVQYNRRPGSRVLPTHFITSATDQCVANGGREN